MKLQLTSWTLGLVTIAISMLSACGYGTPVPEPRRGSAATAPCPTNVQTAVLPDPIEATRKWLDVHEALLRTALVAAEVSPLWCGSGPDLYRVIFVPSSRPLIIAEAATGSEPPITRAVTFIDPRFSEENRTLVRFERVADTHRSKLDPAAAETIGKKATSFWTMPAFRENTDTMDGYIWIIESRRQGTYRMVIRDNVRDAAFEELAISILRAAGVIINEDTIGDYARQSESAR